MASMAVQPVRSIGQVEQPKPVEKRPNQPSEHQRSYSISRNEAKAAITLLERLGARQTMVGLGDRYQMGFNCNGALPRAQLYFAYGQDGVIVDVFGPQENLGELEKTLGATLNMAFTPSYAGISNRAQMGQPQQKPL